MRSTPDASSPRTETSVADREAPVPAPARETPAGAPTARPSGPAERFLAPRTPAELFGFLFSPDFLEWIGNDAAASALVATRLRRPYPSDDGSDVGSPWQAELATRLGIVKALAAARADVVRPLLLEVLARPEEHWLVKRQALRSFSESGNSFRSEDERERALARLDPRAVATATISDTDMMERAINGK